MDHTRTVPVRVRARTHLLRYTLRPPLAKGRLSERADGTVVLELKRAWSDGTWQVSFSRADFVGKLAALVPPPRSNQTVYHGVLAGNAGMREAVVPPAPERTEEQQAARKARKLAREPTRDTPGWADLLLRVFGEDVLVCRHCRGPLSLHAGCTRPPRRGS